MKKHLQVSFRVGNRQEVWIQHPALSAAIHAFETGTGSHDQVMAIADGLVHHLGGEFAEDITLELDEIYDGKPDNSVELWDFNTVPTLVKRITVEAAE